MVWVKDIFYVYGCFTYMYVCASFVYLMNGEARKGGGSSGTAVTDSCELPCGSLESNLGLLEEQPVLLTADPSLLLYFLFNGAIGINMFL